MLVIDEYDSILDAGFKVTIDLILSNLPKTYQTLIYSATMTADPSSLSRLNPLTPIIIQNTPKNLSHKYVVIPLDRKLDFAYSFLKSHLKSKTLLFATSCKQVRFIYSLLCKLKPGLQILHLHGKMSQLHRCGIYAKFIKSTEGCLVTTDVCQRGLDFPKVDWVVQYDLPLDLSGYIHRVGRTARYNLIGKSILLTDNAESSFVQLILKSGIDILEVKPKRIEDLSGSIASFVAENVELKYLAQKTFITYIKSLLLRDKNCLQFLDLEKYASSLGLVNLPKITKSKGKNVSYEAMRVDNSNIQRLETGDADEEEGAEGRKRKKTKIERMFDKKNNNVLSEHFKNMNRDESDENEEDFLILDREGLYF
jgi:ATP-dependent RNA helicase DDX10/DBP4